MDQLQQTPIANTPPANAGDAPVAAAVIPPGMTSEQRLAQLKADPSFNQRLISGDQAATAEMLALLRHSSRQPSAIAAPSPAVPPPAQSTLAPAVVDGASARAHCGTEDRSRVGRAIYEGRYMVDRMERA
jgi:hypothetical protein